MKRTRLRSSEDWVSWEKSTSKPWVRRRTTQNGPKVADLKIRRSARINGSYPRTRHISVRTFPDVQSLQSGPENAMEMPVAAGILLAVLQMVMVFPLMASFRPILSCSLQHCPRLARTGFYFIFWAHSWSDRILDTSTTWHTSSTIGHVMHISFSFSILQ